jgi:hypothetical protein
MIDEYLRTSKNTKNTIYKQSKIRSSGFGESNDVTVFSETFSAEEEVILSDETHLAFTVSAFSAIFSEFSSVSSPEQVWHFDQWLKLIFYIFNSISYFNSFYISHYFDLYVI